MFKFFHKLFTSRVFWVGLVLLFEFALIGLFGYAVFNTFMALFGLNVWQTLGIVIAFLYVVSFLVSVYIVNTNANAAYKVAWIVLMVIVPFVGCFFYLMFGNKKITNRERRRMQPVSDLLLSEKISPSIKKELDEKNINASHMASYIARASGFNIYKDSDVTYYPSGEAAYSTILEELNKAKSFIFIEYFIIAHGIFWDSIVDILKKKVLEGVDVRLIYDDFGSMSTVPRNYSKELEKNGIKVIVFHKFQPFLDVKLNNRDHRKILVIDGVVGFSGGINFADEYINKKERFGYWKDNVIRIKGKGTRGLTRLFLSQWYFLSSSNLADINFEDESFAKYFPATRVDNPSGYVQPYGDLPYDEESVGERVYINLLARANKYVYMTTPYLIISDELRDTLIATAKSGVDVRLITPHIPDKKTTFKITRSYYGPLLKNGIKIYEFTPGFVHMKMFVSDDMFGTVGTINLDYRSLYLHFENGTFMYNTDCIKDMKADFIDTMNKSMEITYEKFKEYAVIRRFFWAFLRLFAPLF